MSHRRVTAWPPHCHTGGQPTLARGGPRGGYWPGDGQEVATGQGMARRWAKGGLLARGWPGLARGWAGG